MKHIHTKAWLCVVLVLAACPPLQAAQQITQKPSEDQSVELTNLEEADTSVEAAMPTGNADSLAEAPGSVEAQAFASPPGNAGNGAGPASSVAKAAAETPMEKYRDLKLQQAATPTASGPASKRRYLKVDRTTYLDAAGLQ